MNILLNAVSDKGMFILFDNNRQIIDNKEVAIGGQESMRFIDLVDNFIKENNLVYKDLENIVVVNGPGSFTGIRTICLAVNTLNYIIKRKLTDVSYFELYESYPIVRASSKRDLFVKKTKNSKIEIISNGDFEQYVEDNKISHLFGNVPDYIELKDTECESMIDYEKLIRNLILKSLEIIEPLYIKKPNIC